MLLLKFTDGCLGSLVMDDLWFVQFAKLALFDLEQRDHRSGIIGRPS
jgi:hypothetical protein